MPPSPLVFLLDSKATIESWSEFMAYFSGRGYPCYTAGWPLGELSTSGGYLLAAGAMTAPITAADAQHKAAGLVLFSPSLSSLLRLGRAGNVPGNLPPVWVGYGARQPSSRVAWWLRHRLHISPFIFQGLGVDLPFQPGWERVAYTVRLWLEGQK